MATDPEIATARGGPARDAALGLIVAVLGQRRQLDDAWRAALAPDGDLDGLDGRDVAFARLLATTVLRRLGQIDAALDRCLNKPLPRRAVRVRDILRLGAAQLLFLGTPAHAAVDTAVAQATRFPHYKALVNAVLRRLAREGADIVARQDAARLNCPDWLWQSWTEAYGEDATRAIVAAQLAEPPLDIVTADDPADWAERLTATPLPTGCLRRQAGGAVTALPGYDEGAWWVQDAAAALPARLLGDVAGRAVLDLCAAPGGKTLQLAAAGAEVTAVDIAAKRLARLEHNLARIGHMAEVVCADVATWRPERPATHILLDLPCSATGTIRRHPDVWRLKTPDDAERLAAAQSRLLTAAVDMLAPGGTLVACVCSLQPEEGPARISALLAAGAPVRRQPVTPAEVGGLVELVTAEGDLRTLPCHLADMGGMDGFYACRLVREGGT